MRKAIHHAIDVDARPDAIWRVFADLSTWPSWFPFADSARADGDPWRAGGRIDVQLRVPVVGTLPLRLAVAEASAPSLARWTGGALGVRGDHRYTFDDRGKWTRVTSHETFSGAFAFVLPRAAFGRIDEAAHDSLAKLKALVENRSTG